MENKLISVIVPCYNENEVIIETHTRLREVCEKIFHDYSAKYEIIYVNDGSKDGTLKILQLLAEDHNSNNKYSGKIVIISLA
ncbi:MAG: glycosyltransferase, partial [Bdellovibrionota bacterium]